MFKKLLNRFFDSNEKQIKKMNPIVMLVNELEATIAPLSDEALREKTQSFRDALAKEEVSLKEILPEAFAVIREMIKRVTGERAFDVQLVGALVLQDGKIAEMKTGEGKTLVATIAAYLNALLGNGVHVVTVNDYLARRDAGWYGKALNKLGLTIGCITHESGMILDVEYFDQKHAQDERLAHLKPCARKEAYEADITYGTNNEFGFDYLRDNMVTSLADKVQRPLFYAIVDEVDSILIDEARTPLIISSAASEAVENYTKFSRAVATLQEEIDYELDEKAHSALINDSGISKVERFLGISGLYNDMSLAFHLEAALKAKALFKLDKDYIIKEGEIVIVDEFTGRLMPGRRYSEGLHQAIEAKEGVKIQRESRTMATITFQNYFRMYEKIAGMTGTAETEAEEFIKIYELDVVVIPTNRPVQRLDQHDLIYKTEREKYQAIAEDVKERRKKGQPVLLGTISVEKNEKMSESLRRAGVPHEILNAKNHEREAEIIANAGLKGAVTLATNMAGRGTDIKLTDDIKAVGGLYVIGSERHEARRIDNQLRGRSGRQGDPGESRFYVSLDDDLMRVFGGDKVKNVMEKIGLPDGQPIEHGLVSKSLENAQKRVEGYNFDTRKHLVDYDDVMNKQREVIYALRNKILSIADQQEIIGEEEEIEESHTEEVNATLHKALTQATTLRGIIDIMITDHVDTILLESVRDDEEGMDWDNVLKHLMAIIPFNPSQNKDDILNPLKASKTNTEIKEAALHLFTKIYDVKSENYGQELMQGFERFVLLQSIDRLWVEHLDTMADLREGISLRSYSQRDPLVVYKSEGFKLFQQMLDLLIENVVKAVYRGQINVAPKKEDTLIGNVPKREGVVPKEKPGPNDPCSCGSGKKYKKCHGKV